MRHALLFTFPFFCLSMSVPAQESDESRLRQKAEEIREVTAKLAESGQHHDAVGVAAAAEHMMALADHTSSGSQAELKALSAQRERLVEKLNHTMRLVRNSNDPALQALKQEIAKISQEIERHQEPRKANEGLQRIQHMRIAAEHLKMAGMLPLARELLVKAAKEELEIAEDQERAASKEQEPHKVAEEKRSAEMEEIRHELTRVRAELEEIRKQIKPR